MKMPRCPVGADSKVCCRRYWDCAYLPKIAIDLADAGGIVGKDSPPGGNTAETPANGLDKSARIAAEADAETLAKIGPNAGRLNPPFPYTMIPFPFAVFRIGPFVAGSDAPG